MATRSRAIVLMPACAALLVLGGCGATGEHSTDEHPSAPSLSSAPSAAPAAGPQSPRSWPGWPTTVAVPKRTSEERARTVVVRGSTRISIADSTASALRHDEWVVRGACAVPSGKLGPGSLTWRVGRAVPGTTDLHLVASGALTCGHSPRDVKLPRLRGKPVQIDVDLHGDITSAYALVVPREQ